MAVATFLLEKGAEVGAVDGDGQTALHWACVRGSLPCAELLLRKGAELNAADSRGYVPLHVAAQRYIALIRQRKGEEQQVGRGRVAPRRIQNVFRTREGPEWLPGPF